MLKPKMYMQLPYDKYIYHFTTSEIALLHILPSFTLKLSSILETNDPKENKVSELWSLFEKNGPLLGIEMKKYFKAFLNNKCRVACFSSDYEIIDDKGEFQVCGFDHPTMWAHYANNFKGVCLVFDKELFIKENEIDINNDCEFEKVNYSTMITYPDIDGELWKEKGDLYFKEFLHENSKDFFFNKHFHWSSEDEVRLLSFGANKFCKIQDSLSGIYLGVNFDMSLLKLIKRLMPENKFVEKIRLTDGMAFPIDMTGKNYSF